MRLLALPLALVAFSPVAFAGPSLASFFQDMAKRTENRTEKLKMGSKLWVKNVNGSIKIQGWDQEQVQLSAEIQDTPERKVTLHFEPKPEGLEIEARFPQGMNFGRGPQCRMELKVPRKILGAFYSTNGSISAKDLDGYARLESTNGAITAENISGEVLANTTNGGITAKNLKARIKGETTNGGIKLDQVEGGIQLETTNGAIDAKNLDGWGEGIRLSSTNGAVHIELGSASGEIQAHNSMGSISLDHPKAEVISKEKHALSARIPGKNQKIQIETTNGGISIR